MASAGIFFYLSTFSSILSSLYIDRERLIFHLALIKLRKACSNFLFKSEALKFENAPE